MHKKLFLPEKVCPICKRPFAWRKKWRNNWEAVIYCSKACRGKARACDQEAETNG
ncbi:hypothetical protein SAMN05660443_0172 [Marinospirillum celere]|uniref:DUF2256 domain-containing protein n=1 Tax=Marinospirillum celere TaxID=1122252 RepID=A0A1I1DWK5_9GAMM|nr:DUF2256 domain-containing protein [Marinospirillum celere]SFB79449.1 hypothetical protein SAMN05660443_0172 [Marinospirillum celere]